MPIARYLTEATLGIVKKDCQFLIERVVNSGFEYDLQLRNGYLNLYYKGNSLGKITYKARLKMYDVEINTRFIEDKIVNRFNHKKTTQKSKKGKETTSYYIFRLNSTQLSSLFSVVNINSMSRKVKKVNFQEETTFEQMLVTDNVNRQDLIIIDRQVVDGPNRKKLDLLALKKKEKSCYQFCVLEVKLGNNPELKEKVAGQLEGYTKWIRNNFSDYKKCYVENVRQKKILGLLPREQKINIVQDVLGVVVVGGYSGVAKNSIKLLKRKYPSIQIIQIKNKIDFKKAF